MVGPRRFQTALYWGSLIVLAVLVLVTYVRSGPRHWGINEYERSLFVESVEGRADKPFAYRALVPTTVRLVSRAVPQEWHNLATSAVSGSAGLTQAFKKLVWEPDAALEFAVAAILMGALLAGFGHVTGRFVARACGLPRTPLVQGAIAALALLGLPPLFRYSSFLYDPAQLFLFTLALLLIFEGKERWFWPVFVLCCLNKETAILLVPMWWLSHRREGRPLPREAKVSIAAMLAVFVLIKAGLTWAFRENKGSFVEFHLDHNINVLTMGWTFPGFLSFLGLAWLVTHHWNDKPAFLRAALPWILVPEAAFGLFFGFLDEWRCYFEAYPVALGLVVHTLWAGKPRPQSDQWFAEDLAALSGKQAMLH